mmetsp:Transcript_26628/g.60928  ORF Transcript_26628/g.60928 Transcript_26628/m.60928 type:complete len:341 (-) Transcript_26628:2045-3067(-)
MSSLPSPVVSKPTISTLPSPFVSKPTESMIPVPAASSGTAPGVVTTESRNMLGARPSSTCTLLDPRLGGGVYMDAANECTSKFGGSGSSESTIPSPFVSKPRVSSLPSPVVSKPTMSTFPSPSVSKPTESMMPSPVASSGTAPRAEAASRTDGPVATRRLGASTLYASSISLYSDPKDAIMLAGIGWHVTTSPASSAIVSSLPSPVVSHLTKSTFPSPLVSKPTESNTPFPDTSIGTAPGEAMARANDLPRGLRGGVLAAFEGGRSGWGRCWGSSSGETFFRVSTMPSPFESKPTVSSLPSPVVSKPIMSSFPSPLVSKPIESTKPSPVTSRSTMPPVEV